MDKNILEQSLKALSQVSDKTYEEYDKKSSDLTSKMNATFLERPDLTSLIGENNIDMMKDNHANHARFMASIFKFYNPDVLLETVLWVFKAYRSHGFNDQYWSAQLSTWMELLKVELSTSSFKEVLPYYEWMQTNIAIFVRLSDESLSTTKSVH